MMNLQLLHISDFTAPSPRTQNLQNSCNCNYSKGDRQKYQISKHITLKQKQHGIIRS
jgi:hypothetical protein